MGAELDEQLCARDPRLFRDRHGHRVTTMFRGFECGDGWFDLLDVLSFEIEPYANEAGLDVAAVQVKEKFGCLRFCERGGDAYVRGLTEMAMSFRSRSARNAGSRALCRNMAGEGLSVQNMAVRRSTPVRLRARCLA